MRKIGELSNETHASVIGAALYVRGMENDIEAEEDGTFSIWVHDDDRRDEAAALLEKFRASPDSPEWQAAASKAQRMRKDEERRDARRASHVITRERIGYERGFGGFASVPMVLSIIAVAITIWIGEVGLLPSGWARQPDSVPESEEMNALRRKFEMRQRLAMTEWRDLTTPDLIAEHDRRAEKYGEDSLSVRRLFFDPTLPEVRRGELWRLFASTFIHFGIIHLLFNLMWLRDLGSFIQVRFGAVYLLVLCAAFAVISSYAQLLWSGPNSGGLSGVNYGLFGYLWMRGKFDRSGHWQLNPQVVQTMMVWFFLCFTPLLPNIANAAHAAGLLAGMITGCIAGKRASARRRR